MLSSIFFAALFVAFILATFYFARIFFVMLDFAMYETGRWWSNLDPRVVFILALNVLFAIPLAILAAVESFKMMIGV